VRTLDALAAACNAGSDCRGCKEKLLELIREETAPSIEATRGGVAAGRNGA